MYEYKFSFTLRYDLSIYSHIKEEDIGVRGTVGWPLISNSFQAIFKSLHHFTERKLGQMSETHEIIQNEGTAKPSAKASKPQASAPQEPPG